MTAGAALFAPSGPLPLHEARLKILPGPEGQQPPEDQPRNLQVVHVFSGGTAHQRPMWGALYRGSRKLAKSGGTRLAYMVGSGSYPGA